MTDDAPPPAGTPIDDSELPDWGRAYLYEGQRDLDRGLQWMLLFYAQKGLDPSRSAIAQRLYISTLGKRAKHSLKGQRGLAADLDLSLQTVNVSLQELVELGWVVIHTIAGERRTRLAWPVRDRIAAAPAEAPALCGQPTKRGPCGRRAGHGTTHRGEGPCYRHGGKRANKDLEPSALEAQVFQPLEHAAPSETPPPEPPRLVVSQRLEHPAPVDNRPYQPPILGSVFQPLETGVPTIGGEVFQPLETSVPTVGTEYVASKHEEFVISQSASDREAHRWLNARYGLTDHESAAVIQEARRRAPQTIKNPVPYLTGMAERGDLADIVAAVMDATSATSQPAPTISAVGQWCGQCDQTTRLTGDPDRPRRCPDCHPMRRSA